MSPMHPARARTLRRCRLLALAGLLALTGCGPAGPGPDLDPDGPAPTASGSGASAPATVPPGLLECDDSSKDAGAESAPQDLHSFGYGMPSGFTESGGYTQITSPEGDYTADYLVPTAAGVDALNVLAVVYYADLALGPVTGGCGQLDRKQVLARLDLVNAESGAEVIGDYAWVEVGGHPAVRYDAWYPSHGFTVRSYAVYGATELVTFGCQWVEAEAVITAGCDELTASVTF
ncbi:hypothetical protein EXU48_18180 [Occultella glacieicola]|uniref:Lipoprotein n=1 Tax=Occultella glacieicola TaxID=2518684 RepID=A0ABY2DZS3_9MICO|nr:hypothetical protein [Occultella glacieicola]TDE90382.1 hypothetical protein EXU48_18180 [Occultella glacieicola]